MVLNAPSNLNDFLAQLKGVLVAPDVALENVTRFRDWFLSLASDGQAATAKTALIALYPDLTTDQADTIYAALTAADTLHKLATGQATQAQANDFFFDARKVWGPNLSQRR